MLEAQEIDFLAKWIYAGSVDFALHLKGAQWIPSN